MVLPMNMNRRGILLGLASALAAPAIVHAGNLMPIRALIIESPKPTWIVQGFDQWGEFKIEILLPTNEESWTTAYKGFAKLSKIMAPTHDGGHMLWDSTVVFPNNNQYSTLD